MISLVKKNSEKNSSTETAITLRTLDLILPRVFFPYMLHWNQYVI